MFRSLEPDQAPVKSLSPKQTLFVILIVIAISTLVAAIIPDYANDFSCFYQAGSKLAAFNTPYQTPCYFSPVWVALLFSSLTFFSRALAYRIYAAVLFAAYLYILWRFSKDRILIALIAIFSPFVFMTMQYGNIDWFPLLGLLLPKPLGLWFLLAKPQMGFTLAALWAWEEFQQRGFKSLLRLYAPVTAGLIVSFGMGMRLPDPVTLSAWSADIWPYGLFIGLPALFVSFIRKDDALALLSAPFLSPYIGPMSWAAILPAAMRRYKFIIAASILSWVLVILWRLHLQ